MKILITGATGFIGKRASERLVEEGYDLICTGRSLEKLTALKDKVKLVYLDIEDSEAVGGLIDQERPDMVFHCAASVKNKNLEKLRRTNVDGTRNVLGACLANSVKRVIYISSIAVINGNQKVPLSDDLPLAAKNLYGISKLEAEEVAIEFRKKGLKVAIIRPPMVYGEGEPHLLSLIVRLIRWRMLPVIGDGNNKLHMVDIDNLVDLMMLCMDKEEACEGTYLVADKEIMQVKEFFQIIAKAQGVANPFHIHKCVMPLLRCVPFLRDKLSIFTKDTICNIVRAEDNLGYVPRISVNDGLKRAVLACSKEK